MGEPTLLVLILEGSTPDATGSCAVSGCFAGLFFQASCTLCRQDIENSTVLIEAVSSSTVHVHPVPLLVEARSTGIDDKLGLSRDRWGQLQISLKAEDWRYGAPQKPVVVEVREITLLAPRQGLVSEDGDKYFKVEPRRLLFSAEDATDVKTFYIQVTCQHPLFKRALL